MVDSIRLRRDGDVLVTRDENGIPHVHATTEADLFYGFGYVQAMDRGLQMLITRILGQGRASEFLESSDAMLDLDLFMRQANLANTTAELTKLTPADRVMIDAFCEGVNRRFSESIPWELKLLGLGRPEPWRPQDSLMMIRLVGYAGLSQGQADIELFLIELAQAGASEQHLREFFGSDQLGEIDIELLRSVKLNRKINPASLAWNPMLAKGLGSNNWVVAPAKSASGHAIMCNDPHLEVNRLPAVWQQMAGRLKNDKVDRYVIGAGMPGIPGILVGRTNDIAWGATYTVLDGLDLWVEDCDEGKYRRDGAWLPFHERKEIIKRKGKPDITVVIHENDHGVLDGDPHVPGRYVAARWICSRDTGARSSSFVREILYATTLDEAMRILGSIETSWNWIIATKSGEIGYQMSGLYPRRRNGLTGLTPQAGWDSKNDWQDVAAAEELPRVMNPAAGYFVTANQNLNQWGVLNPSTCPMGPERANRIEQLLAQKDKLTVEDMYAIQQDVYSLQAEAFIHVIRPLLPDTSQGRILREWDLHYDVDSRGAWLFEQVYRELIREVFSKQLGIGKVNYLLNETPIVTAFYACFDHILLMESSVWFGGVSRDTIYKHAIERALTAEPKRWGDTNRFTFSHLIFGGRLPHWLGFDRGPFELKGGRATPHQAQIFRAFGRQSSFAPSVRLVADFARDGLDMALAGGPTDRRFSTWYASNIGNWLKGEYETVLP